VDFLVEGTTRVSWELRPDFPFKGPITFQLQVGDSGLPDADDWLNVGSAVVDRYLATDATRRAYGKQLTPHYRVVMTDGLGLTYVSSPATPLGNLTTRDWILAKEILRQEQVRLQSLAGVRGFLLKRRRAGEECPTCLDPVTGQSLDSNCQICYGTRIAGGYFAPLPHQYVEVPPYVGEEGWTAGPEGTSLNLIGPATFLGLPILSSKDLWVDASSDLRYHIGKIETKKYIRSLPLVVNVSLEQLDFSHVAYKIPVGDG
jgi:hypothetical protein